MIKYIHLTLILCVSNYCSLLNSAQNSPIEPPRLRFLDFLENRADRDLKQQVYNVLSTVAPVSDTLNSYTQESYYKLLDSYQNLEKRNKKWTPRKKYLLSMLPFGMNFYMIGGHLFFLGTLETKEDVKFKSSVRHFLRMAKDDPCIQNNYLDQYNALQITYQEKKEGDNSWIPSAKMVLAFVISLGSQYLLVDNKDGSGTIRKNE